jgi:hypothetical protein
LIKLIANPDKWNGKRVRVMGYLHLEFEGNGIYVSKADFDNDVVKNGLWVTLDENQKEQAKDANDGYVLIEARFDGNNYGHMGLWSGALWDVTRVMSYKNTSRKAR